MKKIGLKKNMKRSIAILLCIAMFCPVFNIISFGDGGDSAAQISVGALICNEYYNMGLTQGQKRVLVSGALLGDGIVKYQAPTDPSLIDLDLINKTVGMRKYNDPADQSNVWTPSPKMVLEYSGGSEHIDLNDSNTYNYKGAAFSLKGSYILTKSVPVDTQYRMMTAVVPMGTSLKSFNLLLTDKVITQGLDILSQNKQYLQYLSDGMEFGESTLSIGSEEEQAAAAALYNQCVTNPGGKFDLQLLMDKYDDSQSKLAFISENRTDLINVCSDMYNRINLIYECVEANEWISQIGVITPVEYTTLLAAFSSMSSSLKPLANSDAWPEYQGYIKSDATLDELKKLDSAVTAYTLEYSHANVVKTSLHEDMTVVQSEVVRHANRREFVLKISAKVVNGEGTAMTKVINKTYSDVFADGTSKDELTQRVNEWVSDCISSWSGEYGISLDSFKRTDSDMDALLTDGVLASDVTYNVFFTPNTYTVTYGAGFTSSDHGTGTGFPDSVPFGYVLNLTGTIDDETVYDYIVNGEKHDQGENIKITQNTTITRTVGRSWEKIYYGDLSCDNFAPDNEYAKNVLSKTGALAIPFISVRAPRSEDGLVTIAIDGAGCNVSAATMTCDKEEKTAWAPYEVKVNGGALNDTVVPFDNDYTLSLSNKDFDNLTVKYRVNLSAITNADKAVETLNLPSVLVSEAKVQKENMDKLAKEFDSVDTIETLMPNLGLVNFETSAANDAVDNILDNCVSGGHFYLSDYLSSYKSSGLYAYYQLENQNSSLISFQIKCLTDNLPIILDDSVFETLLRTYASSYQNMTDEDEIDDYVKDTKETFEKFIDSLKKISNNLIPANEKIVLTNKSALQDLCSLLVEGVESKYSETYDISDITGVPFAYATFSLQGAEKVSVSVRLKIMYSGNMSAYGGGTRYSSDLSDGTFVFNNGHVLTAAEAEDIQNALKKFVDESSLDVIHYVQNGEVVLPKAGDMIEESQTYTVYFVPRQYTVEFTEGGMTVGSLKFFYDDSQISLPKYSDETGTNDAKYVYKIGDREYSEGDLISMHTFCSDSDTITVKRETVARSKEILLNFVTDVNDAFYQSKLRDNKDLDYSLLPLQNENGNIDALVLRVTPKQDALGDIGGAMSQIAMAFMKCGYSDISIAGKSLYKKNDKKTEFSIQALIDMLGQSGISTESLTNGSCFDSNGAINETDISGYTIVKENISSYPSFVNTDSNKIGGTLFKTTCKNDGDEYDLYVTLETFGKPDPTKTLKQLYSSVLGLKDQISFAMEDEKLKLNINIPDEQYSDIVALMLMDSEITVGDIGSITSEDVVNYLFNLFDSVLSDEDMNCDVVSNTLNKLGFGNTIKGKESTIQMFFDFWHMFRPNTEAETRYFDGACDIEFASSVKDQLDEANEMAGGLIDVPGTVREYDNGLKTNVSIKTPDRQFVMACIDTDKFTSGTAGLAESISLLHMEDVQYKLSGLDSSSLHTDSICVLLSDITGDLALKDVILDLNGHTIDGNLSIVNTSVYDCSLKNTSKVTGTVEGTGKIYAGHYDNALSPELVPLGFEYSNGYVQNSVYDLIYDEQGNYQLIVKAGNILSKNGNINVDIRKNATDILYLLMMKNFNMASLCMCNKAMTDISFDDMFSFVSDLREKGDDAFDDDIKAKMLSWFDNDAMTYVVRKFSDTLSNYELLLSSLDENTYAYTTDLDIVPIALNLSIDKSGKEMFIECDMAKEETKETSTFGMKISDDSERNARKVLTELAKISKSEMQAKVETIEQKDSFKYRFNDSFVANQSFDFSGSINYPIILSVLLCDVKGSESFEDAQNAIKAYYDDSNTALMEDYISSATLTELKNAISLLKVDDFSAIADRCGLYSAIRSSTIRTASTMRGYFALFADVLQESDLKLGDCEEEYGVYKKKMECTTSDRDSSKLAFISFENVYEPVTIGMSAKFFSNDEISVSSPDFEFIYKGTDLGEAMETLYEGCILTLKGQFSIYDRFDCDFGFKINGSENITFQSGAQIVMKNKDSSIVSDGPLNIVSGVKYYIINCETDDGVYTYSLEAQNVDEIYPVSIHRADGEKEGYNLLSEALSEYKNGDTLVLNDDVKLDVDAFVKGNVKIDTKSNKIDTGVYRLKITLGSTLAINSDMSLDSVVSYNLNYYSQKSEPENGYYKYTLAMYDVIVRDTSYRITLRDNGELSPDAFKLAGENGTITLNAPVTLNSDIRLKNSVTVENAGNLKGTFTVYIAKENVTLTCASQINVESEVEFYNIANEGNVYSLKAIPPKLSGEVMVDSSKDISRWFCDNETKTIVLDANPEGLTFGTLAKVIHFYSEEKTTQRVTYTFASKDGTIPSMDSYVTTSSSVTATAENNTGLTDIVTFNIVVMGDINKDGTNSATDLSLIVAYCNSNAGIDEDQIIAANMNMNSFINATDCAMSVNKIVDAWQNKSYVSGLCSITALPKIITLSIESILAKQDEKKEEEKKPEENTDEVSGDSAGETDK